MPEQTPTQYLLSLPPASAAAADLLIRQRPGEWFAACDPSESRLGSGGGMAHLLVEAWNASGRRTTFRTWLASSKKIVLHGGGQSRRLPAYAAVGKPFIPIPVFRRSYGQSIEQCLIDIQLPDYERVLEAAPAEAVLMITSGDVLLRYSGQLPRLQEADVLALGMTVTPEQAEHFGVFFSPKDMPGEVSYFLQKPPACRIRELATRWNFLIDTGAWLLSERAVMALMEKCGWDDDRQNFRDGVSRHYELYAGYGESLGLQPDCPDDAISALTAKVVSLPSPEFYHLGTSRQLVESVTTLQNSEGAFWSSMRHPDQFVQNSVFETPVHGSHNHTVWIENSYVPAGWRLQCEHVITGVPENDWQLTLERGVCLDFAPIGSRDVCVRTYGFDDAFAGNVGTRSTTFFGRPAAKWFAERGIDLKAAAISPTGDIQQAPLFPVMRPDDIDPRFVEWLFCEKPEDQPQWAKLWISLPRLSADQIGNDLNIERLDQQRAARQKVAFAKLYVNQEKSVFPRLDLRDTARVFWGLGVELSDSVSPGGGASATERMHYHMFRSAMMREAGDDNWLAEEEKSFAQLREALIAESLVRPAEPVCSVIEDQIIWGRSPVRLDLAGGWTDTPPYCLEHGGKVVNVAVNLNGQPPVQVFAKLCKRPEIIIRSIDLGAQQKIRTYEQLETYAQPGSEFALAKAALAMAGFQPKFHARGGYATLQEQLEAFGAGIEVSLLAAVPQGSGLGTSSILGATLLGTLSELCGLGWDRHEIIRRTLAVEQMLTTGGGWQDQAGAVFGGLKLVETDPGLSQRPTARWLPERLFGTGYANETVLLYYTGLTRMAKGILQDIVRGMFLNSRERVRVLDRMRDHAQATFEAIQRNDWDGLCESVRTSWDLNQRLDSGTNPPGVQDILGRVANDLSAAKLLGAGGGGYMLMLAADANAARRIRGTLAKHPPNSRARFVDLTISNTGLEITRS